MKTLLFVDDEPRVLQGLQRQLWPMRNEWDMHFVGGAQEALLFMEKTPVDIIVSDMVMPGLDGGQLLAEVVKRHPQTVRIILSGHAEREALLRLVGPAHQYLSKPCDANELRGAIMQAFALRDLLGNERLKQLTTRIKNLPTLPAFHEQLSAELRQESPSMENIGAIISRDIGMTTKILQLVNSAFFGLAQPITSPAEAATYLGLTTIRALVLSVGIFLQYDAKACRTFSLDALAEHSWITGTIARSLAQAERLELKVVEQCFLAGLVHDVGQLVLAFGLPAEYEEVLARANAASLPLWQVEHEIFGATHADVGAYLLALWGLPNPIVEAVAMHHEPGRCPGTGFSPAVAVHVADVFAHQLFQSRSGEAAAQLDEPALDRLGLADRVDAWRERCGALQTSTE